MFELIYRRSDGWELWKSYGRYIVCNKYQRKNFVYKSFYEAEKEYSKTKN